MRAPRKVIVVTTFLILMAVGMLVVQSSRSERAKIRIRYQQLSAASISQDKNATLALIAPEFRDSFYDWRFTNLSSFAQPFGPRSSIVVFGKTAFVYPELTWSHIVIPRGHTIYLVKTNKEWFFTGEVHID